MNYSKRKLLRLTLLCLPFQLAACVTTQPISTVPPPYISSPTACALVLGGGGMLFGNAKVDELWFKANSAVSNSAADELGLRGYKIEKLIVQAGSSSNRAELMGRAIATHECSKLVQISHVKETVASNAQFGFDVEILYPSAPDSYQAKDGRIYKFLSEYRKQYRYPFEVFENLSLSSLGREVARDIHEAGIIKNRTVGSGSGEQKSVSQ